MKENKIESVAEKDIREATEYLIEGLGTDGAHHKQWYIESALAALLHSDPCRIEDLRYTLRRFGHEYERGIAP